jgi:DmsE family decaheme c-type cytochrome
MDIGPIVFSAGLRRSLGKLEEMMKILIKLMVVLALFAGSVAQAADKQNLPDMGPAAKPVTSAAESKSKDALCTRCHDESESVPVLSIYKTRHGVKADSRTPTCQSCHGESTAHLKGDANSSVRPRPDMVFAKKTYKANEAAQINETCLTCHKSGLRQHWTGSQHESNNLACVSCHNIHTSQDKVLNKVTQPEVCFTCHKDQRAQTHRISTHPLAAGKMSCSDCHNPHGSTGPKLLIKNTVSETCFTCHAEKRGPFLWQHEPVIDDCMNCHTPHGSTNPTLLKSRVPFLCQDCHSGDHAAAINSGANLQNGNVVTINGALPLANTAARIQATGRACLQCHVLIHGSNHPAGSKFQR